MNQSSVSLTAALLRVVARRAPDAQAYLHGSRSQPNLSAQLRLWQTRAGMLCVIEAAGLPVSTEACAPNIFAFHLHAGTSCAVGEDGSFRDADGHFNPGGCPHPAHAGDLPPLFATRDGRAFLAVLTDRLTVDDARGHVAILHAAPDDFTTQPSGNAGEMLACGVVK